MNELERRRLERQVKWTPRQVLDAVLCDLDAGNIDPNEAGAVLSQVAVMCVVELANGRRRLVTYSAGFDNVPEELGYLTMFMDKLMVWWKGA